MHCTFPKERLLGNKTKQNKKSRPSPALSKESSLHLSTHHSSYSTFPLPDEWLLTGPTLILIWSSNFHPHLRSAWRTEIGESNYPLQTSHWEMFVKLYQMQCFKAWIKQTLHLCQRLPSWQTYTEPPTQCHCQKPSEGHNNPVPSRATPPFLTERPPLPPKAGEQERSM